MGLTQRRPARAAIGLVVSVDDKLQGARLARIVALAHIKSRLPALNGDGLEDTRLGVGVGVDVGSRRCPIRKLNQPQAADGIFVVVGEQRP